MTEHEAALNVSSPGASGAYYPPRDPNAPPYVPLPRGVDHIEHHCRLPKTRRHGIYGYDLAVDTNDEGVLVINDYDEFAQHVQFCPVCGFEGATFCLIDTNTECDRRDGHPGVCMRGPNAIHIGPGTE